MLSMLLSLSVSVAHGSIIGVNSRNHAVYQTLNLTKRGDVALSVCPSGPDAPVADCDPEGASTMVVARNLFDSVVARAAELDWPSRNALHEVTKLESKIRKDRNDLAATEAPIQESQKKIAGLRQSIATLTRQIQEVELRLQDPALAPEDRKELLIFIERAKGSIAELQKSLSNEDVQLRHLKSKRTSLEREIAAAEKAKADALALIASRKSLFERKAAELADNLDNGREATVYETESLYYVAFLAFDPKYSALQEAGCAVEATFLDGLGTVRATISLSQGIFPKTALLEGRRIELYDGATHDISMLESGKFNWHYTGEVFDYVTPLSRKKVACKDRTGIPGPKQYVLKTVRKGDYVPDNRTCNGKPLREHVVVGISYLGRHDRKTAERICARFPSFSGYSIGSQVFGPFFFRRGYLEGSLNNTVFEAAPFSELLAVSGHDALKDGRYAWGSSTKPYVFEYSPKTAQVIDMTGTPHEGEMDGWVLPTLCTARLEAAYCDFQPTP